MDNTGKTIFREMNLKQFTEPECFDSYLRVTGFGPWFVLLAAALVLAAIFVWAFFGRLQTTAVGAGICKNGTLLCYVAQKDFDGITEDTAADIEGSEGEVTGMDATLHSFSELPKDVLLLLPDSRWYCEVSLRCPLVDGVYTVIFQNPVQPASFMTRGD